MANLAHDYIEAVNGVLAINYYGEVLTVELISNLLRRGGHERYRGLLVRQLIDETRHANITRKLLLERGGDPLVTNSREDFTFHQLFREYDERGGDHVLAFLCENENLSSRNFSKLIRIAKSQGDDLMRSLYSEILNDEVQHSNNIKAALPTTNADLMQTRLDARARMKRFCSFDYLRLFRGFDVA